MAAAARPGPPDARDARDARVPCPLCGGLIHPIAGKCKHCKADLTAYRSARPAASAPLPALSQIADPGGGQPAPAPIARFGHHVAPPVLPPHPITPARASRPAGSAWRSWPIFVIVVAMMAIVAAVALMMWPARGVEGKRALPPPAPERMNTRTPPITPNVKPAAPPPPPQGGVDPWSARPADPRDSTAALTDPNAPSDPGGTSDPDDLDLSPDDPVDPFASPHAPRPRRPWPTRDAGGMMEIAMMAHLCQKLARCGITNAQMRSQARRVCYTVSHMPATPPSGCLAAQRCLGRIDAMTCTDQPDALQAGMVLMQSSDCVEATRC